MEARKPVHIFSYDVDGCLLNSEYQELRGLRYKSDERGHKINPPIFIDFDLLMQANAELFNHSNAALANASSAEVIVGSNRQDVRTDKKNGARGGVCIPTFKNIAEALQAQNPGISITHDQMLLADIYNNRPYGNTYTKSVQYYDALVQLENSTPTKDSQSFVNGVHVVKGKRHLVTMDIYGFDGSKVSLLYAQMHHAASKVSPDQEVVFHFYDDHETIINGLYQFYSNNPDLIPANVTLRLNQYNGKIVKSFDDVKGKAKSYNPDYANDTKRMFACAGYDIVAVKNEIIREGGLGVEPNVLDAFAEHPEKLKEFKVETLGYLQERIAIARAKQDPLARKDNLVDDLEKLQEQLKEHLKPGNKLQSAAKKLLIETNKLLIDIKTISKTSKEGELQKNMLARIDTYKATISQTSGFAKFVKAALAVAIGLVAAVLAGGLGFLAASVPGAVGGALVGVALGVTAGIFLFKSNAVEGAAYQMAASLQARVVN